MIEIHLGDPKATEWPTVRRSPGGCLRRVIPGARKGPARARARGEEAGPMSEIVLVHGIAQERSDAGEQEAAWRPALVRGVREAGFPDVADRIGSGAIGTSMAFYGNLFLARGAQGLEAD